MALTFPLTVAQFASKLFLEDAIFTPQRSDETTGMGSLDVLSAQLATPLWRVSGSTGPILNEDAEGVAALFEMLEHPGRGFYIGNPRKPGPREDPTGSILGSRTITISAIAANNRQISLSGFAAGYILSAGDMVEFDYGPTAQKRRALHRIGETLAANGSGIIANIEVSPHIRTGAVATTVVKLVQPSMLAKIIPGSYSPRSAGAEYMAYSFSAIQKLF